MLLESGFILATLSSAAWSALNVLRKFYLDRYSARLILLVLLAGQAPLFGIWFLSSGAAFPLTTYFIIGLSVVALTLISQFMILEAFEKSDISIAVPFLSFVPVATALFGVLILSEQLSLLQWLGIALVVIGGFAIHVENFRSFAKQLGRLFQHEASLLIILTSIAWGIQIPLEKEALKYSSVEFHGLFVSLFSSTILLLLLWKGGQLESISKESKKLLKPLAFLGLFSIPLTVFAALSTQLMAIQSWPVAVFESYHRAFEVIVGLIAGAVMFNENITLQRCFAAGIMLTGSVMVICL